MSVQDTMRTPIGTLLVSPDQRVADYQLVVGHANVYSDRLDYPPTVLVIDLYGSHPGCEKAYHFMYAETIKSWTEREDYIKAKNPNGIKCSAGLLTTLQDIDIDLESQYKHYRNNVLKDLAIHKIPTFGGATMSASSLSRVKDLSGLYYTEGGTHVCVVHLLHSILMETLSTMATRLSVSDSQGAEIASNSLHRALKELCRFNNPLMPFQTQIYLARKCIFQDNCIWVHHTSKQHYTILGLVHDITDAGSWLVVYANVNNNNVYVRAVADWHRSMTLVETFDI